MATLTISSLGGLGGQQPEGLSYCPDWENREVSTGTTIMALQFDGVVLEATTPSNHWVVYIASE